MTNNCFHFSVVKLYVRDGQISTSVFIKDTDKGLYCSYLSHTLPQYKRSIIKDLVHRALKLCSSYKEVDVEMSRLKQVFVNNEYPLSIIDKVINNTLNRFFERNERDSPSSQIEFFVNLTNFSSFNTDTKTLKTFCKNYVKTKENISLKISTYYKPHKLSSCFPIRPAKPTNLRSNVLRM